jgi:hypothetical protein
MDTKKILIAGLVGGVIAFFLGWLLFGILMKDMMPEPIAGFMRDESDMIMWAMVVSNLLFGLLFAFVFVQWANISTFLSGAKAGAILGFLIAGSYDFSFYAMSYMFKTTTSLIADILMATLWSAIIGGVVGWWLGRGNK